MFLTFNKTIDQYSGFINCLYCGQDSPNGDNWQEVLNEEIEWFNQNKKLK